MRKEFVVLFSSAFVVVMSLGATSCQKSANHETSVAASVSEPAKTEAAPEKVDLNSDMLSNVKIEQVRLENQRGELTATGKVQLNEDETARVLAPLPGQVQDFNLHVGDMVKKDQVLFSIKSREIASLVTDYIESQHDQDLAQKTFNMNKDLFEHQAASRISYQQAESDLAKANSHVARAEEALRVLGLDPKEAEKDGGLRSLVPVHSPASGTIIDRTLTPGQFVQADSTPLLTIADMSSVWVIIDVFESDIHAIHPGLKVQVVATAYPNRKFTASVERISDKVDPDTRTLKVRMLVPNSNFLLKPEMFVSASLQLGESTVAALIPSTAVFTEGGNNFVFVADGEKSFGRRLVSAAPDGEGRLRVTSGLHTGDRIVTDGALLLNFRQKQQKD